MTISAKVVADSVSPQGKRLTTVELRYPKFIHGELMTHRVFSRNASSSRAIPVERLLRDIIEDPAMPVLWFKNKPGMQGTELCTPDECRTLVGEWLRLRDEAIDSAQTMASALGAHKQHVNRAIEPWCHISVVVTATEWSNFFALRCHPDAQPEMRVLAEQIRDAMASSVPIQRHPGEWHLPYVGNEEWQDLLAQHVAIPEHAFDVGRRISVARCARVSYKTHDGAEPRVADDLKLYERLVGSVPLHASPAEHQATPDVYGQSGYHQPNLWGNFVGWVQYRKTLPGESQ